MDNNLGVPVVDPNALVNPTLQTPTPTGDIQSILQAPVVDPNLLNNPVAPITPESIDLDALFQAQLEAEMARQAQIQLQQQQAALAFQAAQMQSAFDPTLLGIANIVQPDVGALMAQQNVAQNLALAAQLPVMPGLPNQVFIPDTVPQTGIIKNYTNYDYFYGRWSKGSAQRVLSEQWNAAGRTGDRGIATLNNRYLVAVSPKFGKVGDNIDVCLDNGVVIPCTIADSKGKDAKSQWGHTFGKAVDVIEWETLKTSQGGMMIDDWYGHKVNSIVNYTA